MMGPTPRDVHIDVPLTNVAIAYRPQFGIGEALAPVVTVNKQSDSYLIWKIEDAFRIEDTKRAPGVEANKFSMGMNSGTFFCDNYALAYPIPDETVENADPGQIFATREGRVMAVMDKLYLDWEQRVINMVTSTSNVGSYYDVRSAWTDYTNADPIYDLNLIIEGIEDVTGYRPNRMAFGTTSWRLFKENANVIDRLYGNQTTGQGRLVRAQNAQAIFEMDQVLISRGFYNSADEGQSNSMSKLWDNSVLVYYAPATPRVDAPSFLYTFRWKKLMDMQVFVFRNGKAFADEVMAGYYQDEKVTASDLGWLLTNVNSST